MKNNIPSKDGQDTDPSVQIAPQSTQSRAEPASQQPSCAETSAYRFTLPDTIRALIARTDKPEYTPAEIEKLQKIMHHYKAAFHKLKTAPRANPDPADEAIIKLLLEQSEHIAWTTLSPKTDSYISLETKTQVQGYICIIPNNHPQALAQKEIARISAKQKAVWIRSDAYSMNMAAAIYAFSMMLLYQRIVQKGWPKADSDSYYQNFVNAYLAETLTLDSLTGNKLKTYARSLNNRFGFTKPEQVPQFVKHPEYPTTRKQFDKIFFQEPPQSRNEDTTRNTILIFSMAFALIPGTPQDFMTRAIQFMRKVYDSSIDTALTPQ